jgi:hypothetical protein
MTYVIWIAAVLMATAAVLLVTGTGAAGLWIAVIAVCIALVAIERTRGRHSLGS